MPSIDHTSYIQQLLLKKVFQYYLSFACCCLPAISFSQSNQTIVYTVKDGLPSNSIYRTTIDKKGYLWLATEIGLSRFDGKKFRTYSTSDGLGDNEITNLFLDSSGTVWVIPFQRTPSFYNPTTDRFENDETNTELSKMDKGTSFWPHVLKYGGVAFSNYSKHIFIYRNNKILLVSNDAFKPVLNIIEYAPYCFLLFSEDSIRSFANGKLKNIEPVNKRISMCESIGNNVYMATPNSILNYQFSETGSVKLIADKKYPFELRIFCKTGKRFAITSLNGTTYLLNKKTLEISEIVSATEGMPVRNVLEDKDDNIWLSTMDRGLVKVQQKRISSLVNPGLKQNFNAILKTTNLYAANNNGEIYQYDGLYVKKIKLNSNKNIDTWVRKIIHTKYGMYVATQSGSFLINEKTMEIETAFRGQENLSTKAAYLLNDSLMLLGSHAFAFLYNLKTGKITDSINKRVSSLGSDLSGNIYIGSNEGLFLWKDKKLISLAKLRKNFGYKISTMVRSPDNLMWIGLGADSLILIKENKWVASIALGDVIPGNICKSLYCNKAGEVWLGTNRGLNRIRYTYSNNQFLYSNTYFGTADGLIGEQVNDITIQDSLVYVATNDGISYLPLQIQLPVSNIVTLISGVSVNSMPTQLKDVYNLKYNENDISINFSGVDLTGFIPFFEYNVNDGKWQRTEKIELKKLAPGNYQIKIRALRRDGKPSINEALVKFEIGTPFWKNAFFWIFIVGTGVAALLYLQQRSNKQKQKILLQKILTEKRITELEMQALKAQINPHFIFNCLNSIKGFIYDKDYIQADKYLDKFSDLMRSTIDNSDASIISLKDELSYLDNYLLLEKLRFEDRFDYHFEVDLSFDQKNIFVPAMLMQPYLENAIRHGMRYLESRMGQIIISATLENNFLVCTIDDNGIGRKKAIELKNNLRIEYQSKGMNISNRRAELYNIELNVIDKNDGSDNATGTTIIVKIPLELRS